MGKKLDGNHRRMLSAVLNKSWKQQPIKQQLTSHLENHPSKANNICMQCWKSKDEFFFYGHLHIAMLVLADKQELTYINSVWTMDIVWKTCWEQWIKRTDEETQSGKSILTAWLDDDDDIYKYIYIYILPAATCIMQSSSNELGTQ